MRLPAPDLRNMTAGEALQYAKLLSGMTVEDIADRAGWGVASLRRCFNPQDTDHRPSLTRIPALCRALGNTVLLDWVIAQLEELSGTPGKSSVVDILQAVNAAASTSGQVHEAVDAALLDGRIDRQEARDIRGACREARKSLERIEASLQPIAGQVWRAGRWESITIEEESE